MTTGKGIFETHFLKAVRNKDQVGTTHNYKNKKHQIQVRGMESCVSACWLCLISAPGQRNHCCLCICPWARERQVQTVRSRQCPGPGTVLLHLLVLHVPAFGFALKAHLQAWQVGLSSPEGQAASHLQAPGQG